MDRGGLAGYSPYEQQRVLTIVNSAAMNTGEHVSFELKFKTKLLLADSTTFYLGNPRELFGK